MNTSQYALLVSISGFLSIVGGFFGGAWRGETVLAQENPGQPAESNILKGRGLVLTDDAGNRRVEIKVDGEKVVFTLLDSKGNERFGLNSGSDDAVLEMNSAKGKPRVVLGAFDDDKATGTMFLLCGRDGKPALSLQHKGYAAEDRKKYDESYFGVVDAAGNPRAIFGWNGDDTTQLSFLNSKGAHSVGLVAGRDTGSALQLSDGDSCNAVLLTKGDVAAVRLRSEKNEAQGSALGAGALWQVKKDGVIRLVAGMGEDATPRVKLLNDKGEQKWVAEPSK